MLLGILMKPGPSRRITLSGNTVTAENSGAIATAQLKVDDDGNMYERLNNGTWDQIDATDDWLRPASGAPGNYQVRFTGFSGNALDSSTQTEDTWHTLSSGDFIWTLTENVAGPGGNSCSFTVEIRNGSSGTVTSASYTLNATRDDS